MIRRAAVIGSPIAHSLSPALHSAAYEALKLDWTYERHEVAAAGAFRARLRQERLDDGLPEQEAVPSRSVRM